MTPVEAELYAKAIQEHHSYMRHVYDTRVEWMKALFFSNIAAVAWVTATGNVQPPGWAFSHTVILMCIFNCVGIFTALFVRVQFVKRQRALEAQVATSATGDQALEMLAKAFPQKAYGVSSIAIAFVLVVATGGWIWALSEHRSEQPSERHAGRRSEPSVETPAHPIATPPHQPSGSDSRPK